MIAESVTLETQTKSNDRYEIRGEVSELAKTISPSKTMQISALATSLRAEGKDIIALSAGELACDTPDSAKKAGINAIENNQTRYTLNPGTIELREAICAKYKREHKRDFSPKQVLVSAGAKQSLFNILLALCGTGDEVITFSPYWVSYPEQIIASGAKMVVVETTIENGFQLEIEQFKAAITPATKVVILNTPSNPTGAVYPKDTVDEICRICASEGIWILTDEIYERIVYPPNTHYSPLDSPEVDLSRLIVVNGFSKTYAMTGWRVGYALGPVSVISGAARLQSHSTSNASSISQAAALGALLGDAKGENDSFFAALIPDLLEKRSIVSKILGSTPPLKIAEPGGAYYMMIDVSGLFGKTLAGKSMENATDVCMYFIEELGVATTPGEAFGAGNYLRLSFSTDKALVEKGCLRIQKGLT